VLKINDVRKIEKRLVPTFFVASFVKNVKRSPIKTPPPDPSEGFEPLEKPGG